VLNFLSGWEVDHRSLVWLDDSLRLPYYKLLRYALQHARRQGANLYALVDSLRYPDVLRLLADSDAQHVSLFQGTKYERYLLGAPFLVGREKNSSVVKQFSENAWFKRALVFVVSTEAFDDMAAHLKRFVVVSDANNIKVFLRFYDPAILHALLHANTSAENELFFGNVSSFLLPSTESSIIHFDRYMFADRRETTQDQVKEKLSELVISERHELVFDQVAREELIRRLLLKNNGKHSVNWDDPNDVALYELTVGMLGLANRFRIFREASIERILKLAAESEVRTGSLHIEQELVEHSRSLQTEEEREARLRQLIVDERNQ
jgi:hypothetical protein